MRFPRWKAWLVVLTPLALLTIWSVLIEPNRLVLHEVTIATPGWPKGRAPLRVAALGDIHAGGLHVGEGKLEKLVALVNGAQPDAIFLLGDYVTPAFGRRMAPEVLMAKLAGFRARFGSFAVLGNHEWWWDGERVRRALLSAGFTVLENEVARIDRGGDEVFVLGLADLWTQEPDIKRPLAKVPEGAPVVVLIHEPDYFPKVPPRVALTLAAHTHGGQVRLPFVGAPIVPSIYGQRYAAGHVVEDGRHLFVTTGVGTSIFPVRFRVPPEVALVTITAAP
jgi:predicted MPP superfamily phosphohydrolase